MDLSGPEAGYIFEMNGVQELVETENHRGSEFFYCNNVPFFLDLKSGYNSGEYRLAVFLTRLKPNQDDYLHSIKTSFQLRLLNFLDKPNKVLELEHAFGKDKSEVGGRPDFISIKELTNILNGWVKNDTLKVQVHLKCDQFKRNFFK